MNFSHCVKSVRILSFFWSTFSRIQTEYGEILRISPYSVRMRENADQKNSEYGHFSCSVTVIKLLNFWHFLNTFFVIFFASGLALIHSLNICTLLIKNTRNTHRSITSQMTLYTISYTECVYNKPCDSKMMSTEQ